MDAADLEKVYDAYASGLFHYLIGFTRCEADARDLLQDLFIKLAQGARKPALSEKAFLYRIAHNLAIDWLRRQAPRGDVQERFFSELDPNPHCTDDPDSSLLASSFASAIQTLPREQLAVVQLRLFDGLTFEEIAAIQSVPLNTAASRWRYALEKLRAILRPLYEEII